MRIEHIGFNPRARVGRDCAGVAAPCAQGCFNPRARVGRDIMIFCLIVVLILFQSTRPRGARLNPARLMFLKASFNPRARVGRDAMHNGAGDEKQCFNPRARVGRDTFRYTTS